MNRSTYRTMTLALAAALILSLCATAMARQGGDDSRRHGGYAMSELTPEQSATVEKLHEAFFTATEPIRQQMIVKQAELKAELIAGKPNAQKVEQLSTELGALRGKMMNERIALKAKLAEAGIPERAMGPCARMGMGCGFGGGYGGGHGGYGGGHGGGYGGQGWHSGPDGMRNMNNR